jgi:hypothetical protein
MFIPRYWSEASERQVLPGRRRVTLRRFGWSSTSQEDADVHARQRLEEALEVLRLGGEKALEGLRRRERRVAYAGGEGLPIREEIVREWEGAEVAVTRNSYGSLCLNARRAMFVDIDGMPVASGCWGCLAILAGAVAGAITGPWWIDLSRPRLLGALAGAALFWGIALLAVRMGRALSLRRSNPLEWARRRIAAWCESHPEWSVRVYETPAGVRLLVAHAAFDPTDERARDFMRFVDADPLYARMCELQRCFRARVSPKPWRIGMEDHFRAGGTWPILDEAKLALRSEWIEEYEARSARHASCRYVETVGSGRTAPEVDEVRKIHDDLSKAETRLEIA